MGNNCSDRRAPTATMKLHDFYVVTNEVAKKLNSVLLQLHRLLSFNTESSTPL